MKQPDECRNMEDIREEIDQIDRDIISAIGKRYGYVKAASKFKTSAQTVKAPERVKAMLEKRRSWAGEEGLDPGVIETIYKELVSYFINREMEEWEGGR
ncbi:MAG: isochorismate lyase [bacterium]|nr:isochorismate lyase [bacterium]